MLGYNFTKRQIMKKSIVAYCTVALSSYATQGDNLIGAGAKSRALAGNAYTKEYGVESIFLNPAQIATTSSDAISVGVTFFMPNVHAKNGGTFIPSKENFETVPYFGYIHPIDKDSSFGIGFFSVSGMGVDYSNYPALLGIKTKLAYAKSSLAYATRFGNFKIGFAIDGAIARLKINSLAMQPDYKYSLGFGYHGGIAYRYNNIHIALTYTSKVAMEYKKVFDFNGDKVLDTLKLTQPNELGAAIGVQHKNFYSEITYKKIFWSQAQGYRDFDWQDQNGVGIGVQYRVDEKTTLKTGASYAQSPLHNASYKSPTTAFFNLVGFPAISTTHYAVGVSYKIDKHNQLDIAFVYAPKTIEHFNQLAASNRQYSLTLGLDYIF